MDHDAAQGREFFKAQGWPLAPLQTRRCDFNDRGKQGTHLDERRLFPYGNQLFSTMANKQWRVPYDQLFRYLTRDAAVSQGIDCIVPRLFLYSVPEKLFERLAAPDLPTEKASQTKQVPQVLSESRLLSRSSLRGQRTSDTSYQSLTITASAP